MKILSSEFKYSFEIKKSKFIIYLAKISSPREALDFINNHADSQANHNCWAYKVEGSYRFSDDGEPSGTAGKPIYNAIINNEFDNIVVLVTRYFGGIKLGAGGLIRAYSGVTSDTLKKAPFEQKKDLVESEIIFEHKDTGKIFNLLKKYNVTIVKENFVDSANHFIIHYERKLYRELYKALNNISAGKIELEKMTVSKVNNI